MSEQNGSERRSHTFDRAGDADNAFAHDDAEQVRLRASDLRRRARGPFGQGRSRRADREAARPAPEEVVWAPPPGRARRDVALSPRLFMLIALVAIVVLGGLAYLFLDSSDPMLTSPAPAPAPASATPATGQPPADPTAAPAEQNSAATPETVPPASSGNVQSPEADAAELERLKQDNQRLQNKLQDMNIKVTPQLPGAPAATDNAEDPATANQEVSVPQPKPANP